MNCAKPVVIVFSVVTALPSMSALGAEPSVKVIKAEEARKYVDQQVTVTFKVQHAKFAMNPDRVYLDLSLIHI